MNSVKSINFNSYSEAVEFVDFNRRVNHRTHHYFHPVQKYENGTSGKLIWSVNYYRLGA